MIGVRMGAVREIATASRLRARRLGIDTQYEAVVFMHKDCPVCKSEGFTAHNRILLKAGEREVIATLYHVTTSLVAHNEVALSELAWLRLGLRDGDHVVVTHPDPLESLSEVRRRIYGSELSETSFRAIMTRHRRWQVFRHPLSLLHHRVLDQTAGSKRGPEFDESDD